MESATISVDVANLKARVNLYGEKLRKLEEDAIPDHFKASPKVRSSSQVVLREISSYLGQIQSRTSFLLPFYAGQSASNVAFRNQNVEGIVLFTLWTGIASVSFSVGAHILLERTEHIYYSTEIAREAGKDALLSESDRQTKSLIYMVELLTTLTTLAEVFVLNFIISTIFNFVSSVRTVTLQEKVSQAVAVTVIILFVICLIVYARRLIHSFSRDTAEFRFQKRAQKVYRGV